MLKMREMVLSILKAGGDGSVRAHESGAVIREIAGQGDVDFVLGFGKQLRVRGPGQPPMCARKWSGNAVGLPSERAAFKVLN